MALVGKGVLAIWNGISESAEAEFVRWHVTEHIPERVGLPGFLRGRRYIAHEGHPKYFNFYETAAVEVLQSPTYRDRLNAPTPWTQRVVKEFRDTSRTICEVAVSLGRGEGGWIEAIQFMGLPDENAILNVTKLDFLTELSEQDGIVGVHLLRGVVGTQTPPTAESKLRGKPDSQCDWILLIEAAELDFIQALRHTLLSDVSLRGNAGGATVTRGVYRLQYGLAHGEAR